MLQITKPEFKQPTNSEYEIFTSNILYNSQPLGILAKQYNDDINAYVYHLTLIWGGDLSTYDYTTYKIDFKDREAAKTAAIEYVNLYIAKHQQ